MYTTIEARLENGKLTGADVKTLPENGRVLVMVLSGDERRERPRFGTITCDQITIADDAFSALSEGEFTDWGL